MLLLLVLIPFLIGMSSVDSASLPRQNGTKDYINCSNRSGVDVHPTHNPQGDGPSQETQLAVNIIPEGRDEALRSLIASSLGSQHKSTSYTKCKQQVPVQTTFSKRSICSWTYECDYDPRRIPSHIYHSVCPGHSEYINEMEYQCKSIRNPIKVLKFKECGEQENTTSTWAMTDYIVRVGCTLIEVQ
jgi:hypothetical protein